MRKQIILPILLCGVLAGCGKVATVEERPLAALEPYESVQEAVVASSSVVPVPAASSPYAYLRPIAFSYEDLTVSTYVLNSEDSLLRKSSAFGERDGIRMDVFLDERTPEHAVEAELLFREETADRLEGVSDLSSDLDGAYAELSYTLPAETEVIPCRIYIRAERVRDTVTLVYVVSIDGQALTDASEEILGEVLEVSGL